MEFSSGMVGTEPPVDGDARGVAPRFMSRNGAFQGVGWGVAVGSGVGVSVGAGVSVGRDAAMAAATVAAMFGVGGTVGTGVAVGSGVEVSVGLALRTASSMVAWISAVGAGSGSEPPPAGGHGAQHQYQLQNRYQAQRFHSPHPFAPNKTVIDRLLVAHVNHWMSGGCGRAPSLSVRPNHHWAA